MAPNVKSNILAESVKECKVRNGFEQKEVIKGKTNSLLSFETKLVWRNILVFILLHIGTFYGLYLCCTGREYMLYGYRMYILRLYFLYIFPIKTSSSYNGHVWRIWYNRWSTSTLVSQSL